ncbi:MAG: DUF2382 domain-containing protein [Xenococcaceae cyanobacterium MO_188.B29]|nr:DUF2382 domain-containing protein [Xenococcaceae cyanobacterium MO_188.B29]
MALVKIADLYPNYKEDLFGGDDIKNFSVYDYANDKIGSVYDIIVDETGRFRYLVIDTGFWIFGKKVLLPVGRASIDYSDKRVYASGLTKEQAENLPEYDENMTIDYDYEEKVRMVYRGVEYDKNSSTYAESSQSYSYDKEPNLYAYQESDGRESLKLYEERLVANKERFRAGTVTLGKRVETETANVSVPIEKERVVIERSSPSDVREVAPGEASFNDSEVARLEVYEESADIEKKAFVREEVSVRKEVDREIVSAEETVRREELQVETEGEVVVNRDL